MGNAYRLVPSPPDPQATKELQWPGVDDDLLATLPPVLRGVVRSLGFARARDFLVDHGGVNVHIPITRGAGLGLEPDELQRLRQSLAHHMDADGRVWMPKADKLFQRARDTKIRKDRQNKSIATLARENNLSSRHILNICREDDDRQIDLF